MSSWTQSLIISLVSFISVAMVCMIIVFQMRGECDYEKCLISTQNELSYIDKANLLATENGIGYSQNDYNFSIAITNAINESHRSLPVSNNQGHSTQKKALLYLYAITLLLFPCCCAGELFLCKSV